MRKRAFIAMLVSCRRLLIGSISAQAQTPDELDQ